MLCWQCQIHEAWPADNGKAEFSLSQKEIDQIIRYVKNHRPAPAPYQRASTYNKLVEYLEEDISNGEYESWTCKSLWDAFQANLIESEVSLNILALWDYIQLRKKSQFKKKWTRRESAIVLNEFKSARMREKKGPSTSLVKTKSRPSKKTKSGHFNTYVLGA